MKLVLRPLLIIGALAGVCVALALWAGRSASAGLYVGGALLCFVAFATRGDFAIGRYGEGADASAIKRGNATRAAYLLAGVILIALGVLVEALGD